MTTKESILEAKITRLEGELSALRKYLQYIVDPAHNPGEEQGSVDAYAVLDDVYIAIDQFPKEAKYTPMTTPHPLSGSKRVD